MPTNNKIPFGLKNDTLVQVSDVVSGLACGCICPACHRKLQANKGKKVTSYFSHDPSDVTISCNSAFETSIHLMAKQILSEEGYTIFPSLILKMSQFDMNGVTHTEEKTIETEALARFNKVELEKRLEEIRPDIIAYQNDEPFLIEVAVTHFVDNKKKNIIWDLGLPAIEIDLSGVSYTTTKDELKSLITSPSKREWISNPKAINAKIELKSILDEKIRKINTDIYKRRNKATTPKKPRAIPLPRNTVTNLIDGNAQEKQYDPRWFVCRNCLNNRNSNKTNTEVVFSVPLMLAPYSIKSIMCPNCNYEVALKNA